MPFDVEISKTEHIAYLTATGDIDLPSSLAVAADLVQHPRFHPSYGIIVDLHAARSLPLKEELRGLAFTLGSFRDSLRGRLALVINAKDLKPAALLSTFVSVFGLRMDAFSDHQLAAAYVSRGIGKNA
jgi:hypothetical protein